MINRLCIIGVGLIGGSLALSLKKAGGCQHIVGVSRDVKNLEKAKQLGVIDEFETDLAKAVVDADVIVIAVPVGDMESVFSAIKDNVSNNAVITDVGSTKASVITAAEKAFGQLPARFVPAHPIAGTEKTGVEAAFEGLFSQRRVILTPVETTDKEAIGVVQTMWESIGAEVTSMDQKHHDEVLAATSHLPHVLAYSLVDTLSRMEEHSEIFQYAAGGFRDFTRIASSDPAMWHDICLANSAAMLKMINAFSDDLSRLAQAIEQQDSDYIFNTFKHAKQERDKFCND